MGSVLSVRDGGGAVLVDECTGDEPVEGERRVERVGAPVAMVWANVQPAPGVPLNPPVPQPQLTNRFSTGVVLMIGEASRVTSTMPPQVRSRWARAKIGNSSTAAAIWCSMTWKPPRWP